MVYTVFRVFDTTLLALESMRARVFSFRLLVLWSRAVTYAKIGLILAYLPLLPVVRPDSLDPFPRQPLPYNRPTKDVLLFRAQEEATQSLLFPWW